MNTTSRLKAFSVVYFALAASVVVVGTAVAPARGDALSTACFLTMVGATASLVLAGIRARSIASRTI